MIDQPAYSLIAARGRSAGRRAAHVAWHLHTHIPSPPTGRRCCASVSAPTSFPATSIRTWDAKPRPRFRTLDDGWWMMDDEAWSIIYRLSSATAIATEFRVVVRCYGFNS